MSVIELRRGRDGDRNPIRLMSNKNSFAVKTRRGFVGGDAVKSVLSLSPRLHRSLVPRQAVLPRGLAIFDVTSDASSDNLPGVSNYCHEARNSMMNSIRSTIKDPTSAVVSCYATYRMAPDKDSKDNARPEDDMVPSGSLFLEFHEAVPRDWHERLFAHYHLVVDRAITYWRGAYVVSVTQATGMNPINLAAELLDLDFEHEGASPYLLDFADPLFHRRRGLRTLPRDPLFAYQWHLRNDGAMGGKVSADIGAVEAWDYTKGDPNIAVAVIDDGFDLSHPGLDGQDKVIHAVNMQDGSNDPSPAPFRDEWHGTAVMGLISSPHDGSGCSGIAPECSFIPIKLEALVDDDAEARAFDYAVHHGAHAINCSWGPPDRYTADLWPLPRITELAMEHAYRQGVCVVFAAGNGNEDMATDGYASHPSVIAVSASTDLDVRSSYSDYGQGVWVCAPSSGGQQGIVTTDVRESGYNPFGSYSQSFGGTSAAAPIATGAIALIQSAFRQVWPNELELTVEEVKAILRLTADKIDENGAPFREYWKNEEIDVTYRNGHSLAYGYGRINVARAVLMARDWGYDRSQRDVGPDRVGRPREPRDPAPPTGPLRLPEWEMDDPLTRFRALREATMEPQSKERFEGGEHAWIGDQGFKQALAQRDDVNYVDYRTLKRKNNEAFSYGELVALSGDFYGNAGDLFYEKPSRWNLATLYADGVAEYLQKEMKIIEKQQKGLDVKYSAANVMFFTRARFFAELLEDNIPHFGWHNMVTYCREHAYALDMAMKARLMVKSDPAQADLTWRRALYTNAFADHFLTDGFAAGHLRVPRKEIIEWAQTQKWRRKDQAAGALSNVLHDNDGHIDDYHGTSAHRLKNSGLHVLNDMGTEWHTRCDGQLFISSSLEDALIAQPVNAVAASTAELFDARFKGSLPNGLFEAARYVPFPNPKSPTLVQKFGHLSDDAFEKLYDSVRTVFKGSLLVTRKDLAALLKALPMLMKRFRADIAKQLKTNPELVKRLPKSYRDAYRNID